MNAISLKNVSFRYEEDSPIILKDASFEFEYGKFYLLFGDSGIGKSTILSLLNGRIPFYKEGEFKGEILHEGKDIYELDIGERSRFISSLFQNPEEQILFDKVEDELAFPMENFGLSREEISRRIEENCERLKLNRHDKTRTLSGGEKQRLEGGCALALNNRIYLLDEPLANLDKKSSELLLGELKRRVREENTCVIVVEHRLDRLSSYVDIAVEVIDGKLLINEDPYSSFEIESAPSYRAEEVLIEAKNIGVLMKDRWVLRNISFSLHKGEKLLVLGDNGSGKTTLLRLLSGFIKAKEGEILYPSFPKRRKHFGEIGYLFQNPNYQLFSKTVREEIFLGKVDEVYAERLIDLFGLREKLDIHPLSLSEGQKRKLTFVSVLAKKPPLLFLDEPTVGQDAESLSIFVSEANSLVRNEGTALLTVTHDKRCMRALADSCLLIRKNGAAELGGYELIDSYLD